VNFSYVSGKGLSFIREYILRLLNIAPMTKMQISVYFGLTEIEATEAIDDLIEQDFIKLNADGRLGLTDSAKKLFTDVASDVSLTSIEESTAKIRFELATFCFSKMKKMSG
jgi:predicted transcriptional regulator